MKRLLTLRFRSMAVIFLVFMLMTLALFAERTGVQYILEIPRLGYLSARESIPAEEAARPLPRTCVILWDPYGESADIALQNFRQILLDMKVGYDLVDVTREKLLDYTPYETAIVLMTDVSALGEGVLTLARWVEQGGQALFPMALEKETYLSLIEQKLGIIASSYEYEVVDRIHFREGFMVGGGRSVEVNDPFASAWSVALDEESEVYAWIDNAYRSPLIWTRRHGRGQFCLVNIGIYEKANRGIYASAYSLLGASCAWPVINGSAFYLDGFPSPVPSGDHADVREVYGTNISDFYVNVWWPDMFDFNLRYGVTYTGVVIQSFDDVEQGLIAPQQITHPFQYYGNMILRSRGEIGYQGYNYQPLQVGLQEDENGLSYEGWESYEAMYQALSELMRFMDEMYPGVNKSVYVPPSNILSPEGRELILQEFPYIKTIASSYFPGRNVYSQEFSVSPDGIVEQPRILSGCEFDGFMQMAALSELNMHFVNSHFMHPYDLLSDKTGEIHWTEMRTRLDSYMAWLYGAAPMLRNVTASEMSGAVQRFAALTVADAFTKDALTLRLGNFLDEAWLLVRLNQGLPAVRRDGSFAVEGGILTHLTGNLYLLEAKAGEITIHLTQGEDTP